MERYLIFTLTLFFLVTCSSQQKQINRSPSHSTVTTFNPLKYDSADSNLIFKRKKVNFVREQGVDKEDEEWIIVHVDREAWEQEKKWSRSLEEDEQYKLGYRIQIYTTTNLDSALAMEDSIKKRFNLASYLEHDAPYYKIRLGDFITYDEADTCLQKIKGYGYQEAWIVRSEICRPCRLQRLGQKIISDSVRVKAEPSSQVENKGD